MMLRGGVMALRRGVKALRRGVTGWRGRVMASRVGGRVLRRGRILMLQGVWGGRKMRATSPTILCFSQKGATTWLKSRSV